MNADERQGTPRSAVSVSPSLGAPTLASLVDALPDPYILLEPVRRDSGEVYDFRFVMANVAACVLHNKEPGGLTGASLLELHPASVETGLLAAYIDVLTTKQPMFADDYSYPPEVPGGALRRYEVRAVELDGCVAQVWREVTDLYDALDRTRAAGQRFRDALDALQEPFLTFVPVRDEAGDVIDLRYTYLNSAARRLMRMPEGDMLGARLSQAFPTALEQGRLAFYLEPLATGQPKVIEEVNFESGPDAQIFELTAYPFGDEIIVMARNVTASRVAQAQLRESEHHYRLLAENAMDLVFSMDTHAVIDWVSPSVRKMLGYEPDELTGQFSGSLINPDDLPLLLTTSERARRGEPTMCRVRMVTSGGVDHWVEVTPRTLRSPSGSIIGGVIGVRDIQDEVVVREALEREATFDGLTGLAKRPLALARIQKMLDSGRAPGWALLCVGVNGLTAINHGYSYAAGDTVLAVVADRLIGMTGHHDRVARIAGDEFIVLLPQVTSATEAAEAAEEVLDAVRGPVAVGNTHVDVTVSVGIALVDGTRGEGDAEKLLRNATAAMRKASSGGRDTWQFLDGDIQTAAREDMSLQADLRAAFDAAEMHAWLMPLVSLESRAVMGFEALARWRRSTGDVLEPGDFMGVAERSGLVTTLDRLMLRQVVDFLRDLPRAQYVAVNVSAQTLASPNFVQWVREELLRSGIDHTRLHLEVTETSLFHVTESVLATMAEVAEMGVAWWVDDFGTGYSSVSHLRDLPLSGLKLDRSFTQAVTKPDSLARKISLGLVGLAHGLDLATVAEGVETAEQASILADQGWELGQGWLYGKAAPVG